MNRRAVHIASKWRGCESNASLPMYDLARLRPHTARLWRWIAERLCRMDILAADNLSTPVDLAAHWNDERLLLSQTCGYPLLSLSSHVRVVATPCYRAEGCDGPFYRSAIVVRSDEKGSSIADFAERRCAINDRSSNSGMNLLRRTIADHAPRSPFFSSVVVSGSHADSLAMVRNGDADLAAIDCVTLALLRREHPSGWSGLRILEWTRAAPGLPLISAGDARTVDALRAILREAETDPDTRPTLEILLIDRFDILPPDAYESIGELEREAIALGYPHLA